MKLAKYLPLLLLCFLTACSDEPSKQTLLSEVENIKLSDIVTPEKGGDDSSLMSELSSARSSLSSTIIALKDGRAVDQNQLNNALIAASMLGSKTVAEFFVEKGANVNARGKDELSGYTPLSAASMNKKGGVYVANFLLQKGADTNLKGKNGNTPLFFAIRSDGAATAKLLIEHGANVNAKGQNGDTPLHEAVRNDNTKAVASLIEHGADVNAKNTKKQTPLQLALDLGKTEIAEILEEHGASGASMRGKYGFGTGTSSVQTEETTTSSNSSSTSYSSSRTSSSSNSSRGKYGFGTKDAPTHSEKLVDKKTASYSNNRYSQEEDSEDEDEDAEETPSEYEQWCKIIKDDHSENLIDIIHALDGGLDPNAVRDDGSGHTILHNVVWEDKRLPVIRMLLDNGADPNAVRTDGSPVLRLCIAKGRDDAEIANILCDYGADVNYKDKDGKTLLDLAVAKNKPKTGRILVSYGAKCTRRHKNMDTPTWKDILNRPKTRTPKNTGLVRKPKSPETSQKSVAAAGEGGGGAITGFGSKIRRNNALEGILFDLKHTNKGVELATGAGNNAGKRKEQLHKAIGILDNSWRVELLKKEYAVAPAQRYTTSIFICNERGGALDATRATAAFESQFLAPGWLCYYEGYFSVPEAGEYRFVGMGDDAMIVGVDRKTVLYAFWPGEGHGRCVNYRPGWEPDNFCGSNGTDGRDTFRGSTGHRNMLYKGSWLKLVPNKRYFIQVAFGEAAGGKAGAWLGIQKKDRDTDTDFPLFTLERMRPDPQLQISETGRYNTSRVFKASQK